MKLYRNVYNVKIMWHLQLWLLSVSELWPFYCFLMTILFYLHSCNAVSHSEFGQDNVSDTRMILAAK